MSKESGPKWWQPFALLPLMMLLLVLQARILASPQAHLLLEIGILVFIYGAIALWMKANAPTLARDSSPSWPYKEDRDLGGGGPAEDLATNDPCPDAAPVRALKENGSRRSKRRNGAGYLGKLSKSTGSSVPSDSEDCGKIDSEGSHVRKSGVHQDSDE